MVSKNYKILHTRVGPWKKDHVVSHDEMVNAKDSLGRKAPINVQRLIKHGAIQEVNEPVTTTPPDYVPINPPQPVEFSDGIDPETFADGQDDLIPPNPFIPPTPPPTGTSQVPSNQPSQTATKTVDNPQNPMAQPEIPTPEDEVPTPDPTPAAPDSTQNKSGKRGGKNGN